MESNIKQRIQELSLDDKAKLYFMGLVRKGEIDTLPENPKAAYIKMVMDNEKYSSEYREGQKVKFNPSIMKDKGFENDITHYDGLMGVIEKVSQDELEIKLNKSITPPGGGNIDGILLMKSKGDYEMIDKEKPQTEDYKPSHRAYNVIDKSNNDKIVAKELSRDKALELAKTNKDYMIDATDRLAEGKLLKEIASELGYLKEVDGMEGGNMSVSNKFDHSKFDFQEKVTKASFVYTEQGGNFYSLTLSTSNDRQIKLKYSEANSWLKDTLEYIHEGDLLPRKYNSGLEDLDLIVARLEELGIEASHGDYMDVS